MIASDNIFTVSQLNQSVSRLLSEQLGYVWLEAEIGQLTKASSGHWYLTLKDPSSQVRCAMFKQRNKQLSWHPQLGDAVLVKAQVTLYEPRGEYQLIIDAMQPAGLGRLQQAFEQLKQKLETKGWFSQTHKRPIPRTVQRVGLVTSATGAAVHDIITVMARRDASIELVIYPCLVQGELAGSQIASQIRLANQRHEVDILIVGRGGGSLEDLWAFNTPEVAEAIFNSQLPVISAVGHEVDVTIADLVADVRAATPSAAAELVTSGFNERLQRLQTIQQALGHSWQRKIQSQWLVFERLQQRLSRQHPAYAVQQRMQMADELNYRLQHAMGLYLSDQQQKQRSWAHSLSQKNPALRVAAQQQTLATMQNRLIAAITYRFTTEQQRFAIQLGKLDVVSPLATLSRGYSICQNVEEKVIRSVKEVMEGEEITTLVVDGTIRATITAVAHNE